MAVTASTPTAVAVVHARARTSPPLVTSPEPRCARGCLRPPRDSGRGKKLAGPASQMHPRTLLVALQLCKQVSLQQKLL